MTIFLETERLRMEAPAQLDIENWYALHSEADEMKFTREEIQAWLDNDILHYQKHGFSMGSVYVKHSKEFIGRAGLVYLLNDDTQPDIEIGYVLHRLHWNKGFAVEIASALIKWGFQNLQISKLIAITRPANQRSQRVLNKIGMHYVKNILIENERFYSMRSINN